MAEADDSESLCKELVFVGYSLGSSLAQLARIDFGTLDSASKEYTDECFGKKCKMISGGGPEIFFGDDIPSFETKCTMENVLFYNEIDVVPILPSAYISGHRRLDDGKELALPPDENVFAVVNSSLKTFGGIKGTTYLMTMSNLDVDKNVQKRQRTVAGVKHCLESPYQFLQNPVYLERTKSFDHEVLKPRAAMRCPEYGCGHTGMEALLDVDFIGTNMGEVPLAPGSALTETFYYTRFSFHLLNSILWQ